MPDRLSVTAVGGQVVLDLREAMLQSLHTIVHATLIGGNLHMLVPEGVTVVVTASRQSGRVGPDLAPRPGPATSAGSPLIEVRSFTVGGHVRVHTPRPPGGRGRGRSSRRQR